MTWDEQYWKEESVWPPDLKPDAALEAEMERVVAECRVLIPFGDPRGPQVSRLRRGFRFWNRRNHQYAGGKLARLRQLHAELAAKGGAA